MLADPRRIRLLLVGGTILLAAVALRLATGGNADPASAPTAPTFAVNGQPPDTDDGDPSPSPVGDEIDEATLDETHEVAAAFAREYLTWTAAESATDRADRIAVHATRAFAAEIADARAAGAADAANRDGGWSQTAEVADTQTSTARPRHIEVTVMAEVKTVEDGDERTVPTNLTVVVREEAGAWRVDDLR